MRTLASPLSDDDGMICSFRNVDPCFVKGYESMYTVNLHVWLEGLPASVIRQLHDMKPMPQFQHEFLEDRHLAACSAELANVVIFTDASGLQPTEVRRIAGVHASCIFCTANPEKLSSEELDHLDELWPMPLTAPLVQFFFGRLQKGLKERKDEWLCRNYWETTINMLPDMIWYKDKIGAHLEVNDAFCQAVGKTKEDIRGRGHYYIWGLTPDEYAKGEYVCMETETEVMQAGKPCVFDEQVKSEQGIRQLKTYKAPIFDENGDILGTVGVARDVTTEHAYEQKILDMARTDELTKLANRRYFYDYINKYRGEHPVSLLYIDVDSFKDINDTYGHQAGDDVLTLIARLLKDNFSDGFIARFGGDEFLVLFLGHYTRSELERRAQSFIEELRQTSERELRIGGVTVSVGISFEETSEASVDKLIYCADVALYWAKQHGRARFCSFSLKISQETGLLMSSKDGDTLL